MSPGPYLFPRRRRGLSAAVVGPADHRHVRLPAGNRACPPGGLPPPVVRRAGDRGDPGASPDAESPPAGGYRGICGVDLRGGYPGAGRTRPEADRRGIREGVARGRARRVQRPGERRRSVSPDVTSAAPFGVLRRRARIDP